MMDPGLEMTDTALKLSKVIEREAKRRSGLRNSKMGRVQANIPTSFRHSSMSRRTSAGTRSVRSRGRDSSIVAPMPEDKSFRATEGRKVSSVGPVAPSSLAREESSRRSEVFSASEAETESPRSWRQTVWLTIDDPNSSTTAYYLSVTIFAFIVISTATFIIDTEPSMDPYETQIGYVETVCAVVFSLELVLRMLFCPSKFAFFRNLANWIDIAAILPYYLERMLAVKSASSLGAVRIVRLTRVARVLKMSRYSSAIQVFVQAISISVKPLTMLIFLMSIAMIIFSSAVYFAELTPDGCRAGGWIGNCPDDDSIAVQYASSPAQAAASVVTAGGSNQCICVDPNPYKSITSSFWWCIVTMSTVGYGDMTPVTTIGKIVGFATVLTGMLVLALPITVIGTNFQKVMKSVIHETMKTNVDYLKGKRMLCRDEIEAILQRFHAVTENIHLDIDDVINVYDTDNSGMLEDEELARFRHDLEVLQNRAMASQMGVPEVQLAKPTPGGQRGSAPSIKQVAAMQHIVRQLAGSGGPHDLHPPPRAPASSPPSSVSEKATLEPKPSLELHTPIRTPIRTIEQDLAVFTRSARSLMIDEEQLLLRLLDMQQTMEDRLLETEQRLEGKMVNLTKILMRLERMMEMEE